MSVSIRLAQPADRQALIHLQRRASLANPDDRELILARPELVDLPLSQIEAGQVFVAERDETLLGFSAVLDREDGDVELDGLFVDPDRWQGGVGRALVEAACAYGRVRSAKCMHVIGNPAAEGFYEKVGFLTTGRTELEFGWGWLMQMRL